MKRYRYRARVLKHDKSRLWWQFIDEFDIQHTVDTKPDQKDNPEEKLSEPEAENFKQLFKNLREVREVIPNDQSCADFIYWAPQVARYSFQSGRVLLTQRDTENTEDG